MKIKISALFIAFSIFLAACGIAPAENASPEKLKELRAQYPYMKLVNRSAALSAAGETQWARPFDALLQAEITGGLESSSYIAYPERPCRQRKCLPPHILGQTHFQEEYQCPNNSVRRQNSICAVFTKSLTK